ncbi:uracil-DNA glycosylase [Erysipelothrix sp. HDW6A]|uniref:uracil-DNA glycosylase n=1 Tax=Erysipelothrix sp. HDW6A TaxID=2714928 RepID=UPI00140E376A|nr:uracil-DNA glycosylase [Erysipelothrix sp. HDW6A]QIK56409.1 uracil-DNA glycosylase [Erysipelothrix sp. HDW6A]
MNWKTLIEQESAKGYYQKLQDTLKKRRLTQSIYPCEDDVFKAFEYTPYSDVKVVIVGQDPYHQPGQAMGLSFSVPKDWPLPKSLINIFKELDDDLCIHNTHGDLSSWAQQGVLLLNTILTVEDSKPLSHKNIGWETFTDRVLSELGKREKPIVFVLWGKKAQDKKQLIDKHHYFIESSHPSPLGAYRGFIGSHPFSKINDYLIKTGQSPINWSNHV